MVICNMVTQKTLLLFQLKGRLSTFGTKVEGKDCTRNLSIGYGCREREHLGILMYNGRLYNVHRENFVFKGDVSKSCEATDKIFFLIFEGQITAPPTNVVLETVTKVIFCLSL